MKFIVTGDNHFRADRPLCRLDDNWLNTQRDLFLFIITEANKRGADLVCTGDLFDVARVPPEIVNLVLDCLTILQGKFYVIAGNHCLPWHKEENVLRSSIGTLKVLSQASEQIIYLDAIEETHDGRFEHTAWISPDICVVHTLTFPSTDEIPFGANATSAYSLLEKYPKARVILTGDYHHGFMYEDDGHIVINPGCMSIQSADMIDYSPEIYYIDTDACVDVSTPNDTHPVYRWRKDSIVRIPLPNDISMLTRNHLDVKEQRDERIASFVQTIMHDGQIGLSFEDNLNAYIDRNNIRLPVRNILKEVEEGNNGE